MWSLWRGGLARSSATVLLALILSLAAASEALADTEFVAGSGRIGLGVAARPGTGASFEMDVHLGLYIGRNYLQN